MDEEEENEGLERGKTVRVQAAPGGRGQGLNRGGRTAAWAELEMASGRPFLLTRDDETRRAM